MNEFDRNFLLSRAATPGGGLASLIERAGGSGSSQPMPKHTPIDTRTFQQYDKSNAIAAEQLKPVVDAAADPARALNGDKDAQGRILSKVASFATDPLVASSIKLYHGSKVRFDAVSPSYSKGQLGFHMGSKEQAKSIFGEGGRPKIMEVEADIKNPLRLDDLGSWYGSDVVDMVNKKLGTQIHSSASDSTIRSHIEKAGYDGVVYQNAFEGAGDSYIAFKPEQVKIKPAKKRK